MEPNQIDILAFAVLRDLEQVDDTPGIPIRAPRLEVISGKPIGVIESTFDLTFFHTIPVAHLDVRARPYSDTASDFSSTNSLAKPLGEHHEESLHSA